MAASAGNGSSIDLLTALCRRELAFVENYRRALNAPSLGNQVGALSTCLRSHEERAEHLKSRLRALQAEPPSSGGVFGAFAKLLERAAAAFGERAGILALDEEEERGMKAYRADLGGVDPESRALIEQKLAPLQTETYRITSELRHQGATGRPATQP